MRLRRASSKRGIDDDANISSAGRVTGFEFPCIDKMGDLKILLFWGKTKKGMTELIQPLWALGQARLSFQFNIAVLLELSLLHYQRH